MVLYGAICVSRLVIGCGCSDPPEAKPLPQSMWRGSRVARLQSLTSFASSLSLSPSLISRFISDLPVFNLSQSLARSPFTFTSQRYHVFFLLYWLADCRHHCCFLFVCMKGRYEGHSVMDGTVLCSKPCYENCLLMLFFLKIHLKSLCLKPT